MSANRKLTQITADRVLSPEDYNLQANNPELTRGILGGWLAFAGAVEKEVPHTASLVNMLTPHRSSQLETFLTCWGAQEAGHGEVLGALAATLGVECVPTVNKLTVRMRMLGAVANRSAYVEGITTLAYLTFGAIAEDETMQSYRKMSGKMEDAGEVCIAEALKDIAAQEARHRAFYIDAAREMHPTTFQQYTVRFAVEHLYSPVGVQLGDHQRMMSFGRAIVAAGPDYNDVAESAEAVAGDLIGARQGFLARTYSQCCALAV